MTERHVPEAAGWIYFDAECRFCAARRRHWGPLFERRGYVWLPLQTPGAAERLGITDAQLREEMWLLFPDGRRLAGVRAWSALMRRVGWLRPLGIVLALPGVRAVAQAMYRWVARRRHCLGGSGS